MSDGEVKGSFYRTEIIAQLFGVTVRRVQQKLKQWGYYTGAVDGVFGQSTYDAVIQFQKKNGLTADGVAGTSNTYQTRPTESSTVPIRRSNSGNRRCRPTSP